MSEAKNETDNEAADEDMELPECFGALMWDHSTETIPTGIKPLDEALGGGYLAEGVNLIAGSPGCGKSVLARQIAMNYAHKHARDGRGAALYYANDIAYRRTMVGAISYASFHGEHKMDVRQVDAAIAGGDAANLRELQRLFIDATGGGFLYRPQERTVYGALNVLETQLVYGWDPISGYNLWTGKNHNFHWACEPEKPLTSIYGKYDMPIDGEGNFFQRKGAGNFEEWGMPADVGLLVVDNLNRLTVCTNEDQMIEYRVTGSEGYEPTPRVASLSDNDALKVDALRRLESLSKRCHMAVIGIVDTTKESAKGGGHVTLADVKGDGSLGYDAKCVIGLKVTQEAKGNKPGAAEATVAKSKDGAQGIVVPLTFAPQYSMFR